MPYNPKTNKWENTTGKLNKERTWKEPNFSKMTDEQLLNEAQKDLRKAKYQKSGQKSKSDCEIILPRTLLQNTIISLYS